MAYKAWIALDFDGVITETRPFPEIGPLKQHAQDSIAQLRYMGFGIIIWTCRSGEQLEAIKNFLKDKNIEYDQINNNTDYPTDKKIYAHLYVDDHGYRFKNWIDAMKEIPTLLRNIDPNHKYIQ